MGKLLLLSFFFLFQKSVTESHFFTAAKTIGDNSEKWICMKALKEASQSWSGPLIESCQPIVI